MIHSGMVSVTFRKLDPKAIIEIAKKGGLEAIEWGGDVHVPPGKSRLAREVAEMTQAAGLAVSSYGSYYRVGNESEPYGQFEGVIETALGLGAPLIRVWAGERASAKADSAWWDTVVDASRSIADMAGAASLRLAFEYHRNTLTDTPETARKLLEMVNHPSMTSYWQMDLSLSPEERMASLETMCPWLSNLHVFFEEGGKQLALAKGLSEWQGYLAHAARCGGERYALLEFVADGKPDNLVRDARTLTALLDELPKSA